MKKLLLSFAFLLIAGSSLIFSAEDASAAENSNQIELNPGEISESKVVVDENGEEMKVSITKDSDTSSGGVQLLGSDVISDSINDGIYTIEFSSWPQFFNYKIKIEDKEIVRAYGVDYFTLGAKVDGYDLDHSSLLATLDVDLSSDIGGIGTIANWRGNLDAFIGQGVVYVTWD